MASPDKRSLYLNTAKAMLMKTDYQHILDYMRNKGVPDAEAQTIILSVIKAYNAIFKNIRDTKELEYSRQNIPIGGPTIDRINQLLKKGGSEQDVLNVLSNECSLDEQTAINTSDILRVRYRYACYANFRSRYKPAKDRFILSTIGVVLSTPLLLIFLNLLTIIIGISLFTGYSAVIWNYRKIKAEFAQIVWN